MANEKINGRDLLVSIKIGSGAYKEVGCSKTASLTITTSTLDATTKCSGLSKETLPDRYSWQITGTGLTSIDAGTEDNHLVIAQTQLAQTQVQVKFSNTAGTLQYIGNGWFTSLKVSADDGALSTFDYTIDGTGPIDPTPVAG